ncbi:MAG: M4 family metallopeptidase [Spirosoma sp.]|nr:M4 family metallopeptidase [Spirosoma sp.]
MRISLLATLFVCGCLPLALAQTPEKGFGSKRKTDLSRSLPAVTQQLRGLTMPVPKRDTDDKPTVSTAPVQHFSFTEPTRPFSFSAPDLHVVRDSATGRPIFIQNLRAARATDAKTGANARVSAAAITYTFLNQVSEVLQISNPEDNFAIQKSETDELAQTHIWLKQTYKGVPINGADLVAHVINGEVSVLNGHPQPTPTDISTTPKLTIDQATRYAFGDLGKETVVRSFGSNMLQLKPAEGELCLYPMSDNAMRLAYKLAIRPNFLDQWQYMIDAETGAVLDKYNSTCKADGPRSATVVDLNKVSRKINTYQVGTAYYLIDATQPMFDAKASALPNKAVGALVTLDCRNKPYTNPSLGLISSANNTNWTPTAVSAHYNANTAYQYYKTVHGRNAIDGKGGNIISLVNVTDEDSTSWGNAAWNGAYMVYGNGDAAFKPLAGGLDVAGHEMTHGVVGSSANLEYKGQSGAMNESFADVFGCMIERKNWTIGEDVVLPAYYPSGALRNLANPNQGGKGKDNGYQPKTMGEYVPNGSVHTNSGIPNYAFYLFATNDSVGILRAERTYYRALTAGYLTTTATFLDLRMAVLKAADDLYGRNSPSVVKAAQAAFDAVGIVEANVPTSTTTVSTPVAQGPDLLLLASSKADGFYSTTVVTTGTAKFDLKTNRGLRHRPSVTDDGKYAYYVSADKRVRYVNLTGTPTEGISLSDTIWDNVAISKDGTKLALLKAAQDKSIYVYSFTKKAWKTFTLYNPTNTQGVATSDVKYADSFDWDQAGEYLVYDAYSEVPTSDGDPVGYWDVGALHVWDGSKGDFADGKIGKPLPKPRPGESIGNPSFSKNSPNILAFDYFVNGTDSTDAAYYVMAADLLKGTLGIIYENNTLGYPSYSRTDDRIVFGTKNTAGGKDIVAVKLLADKTKRANLLRQTMYSDATWPVWYTQAIRVIPTRANQTITFNALPNRTLSQTGFSLSATASSGLPVGFVVVGGPAEVTGNKVKLTALGSVTIIAYQAGNEEFYEAPLVVRSFSVVAAAGGRQGVELAETNVVLLYPNPVGSELTVELTNGQVIEQLAVNTLSGTAVVQQPGGIKMAKTKLDLSKLPSGMYLLSIQTPQGILTRKLIRE